MSNQGIFGTSIYGERVGLGGAEIITAADAQAGGVVRIPRPCAPPPSAPVCGPPIRVSATPGASPISLLPQSPSGAPGVAWGGRTPARGPSGMLMQPLLPAGVSVSTGRPGLAPPAGRYLQPVQPMRPIATRAPTHPVLTRLPSTTRAMPSATALAVQRAAAAAAAGRPVLSGFGAIVAALRDGGIRPTPISGPCLPPRTPACPPSASVAPMVVPAPGRGDCWQQPPPCSGAPAPRVMVPPPSSGCDGFRGFGGFGWY